MTDQSTEAPSSQDGDMDLRQLIRILWSGKLTIMACTIVVTLLSLAYAFLAKEIFSSQALVQVRGDESGTSGITAQLGGLASLAGVSLGSGSANREFAIAALTSRAVIQKMIEEEGLLQILYEDAWDSTEKRWTIENPKKTPTAWKAYKLFTEGVLRVSEDKKTKIVTVAIEWENPELAAVWVSELIGRVNTYVNAAAIREAEENLKFLEAQAQTATVVELQQTIASMMETEIKKLMVARNPETAALRVIDPPVVPERRIRPKRGLIAVLGVMLGGMLGVVAVLCRSAIQRTKSVPAG